VNRRRFLGLVGLTMAAAVTAWEFVPQIKQAAGATRQFFTRGTYAAWDRPGVPPTLVMVAVLLLALLFPQPAHAAGNVGAVARAQSAVGSDMFGPYGCGMFVAWAYGIPGIGYYTASDFYQAMQHAGRIHPPADPAPPGSIVFSNGADGGHVDIAVGDGTYISGGVMGFSPGYGNGHNVQVLPVPNTSPGAVYLGWSDPPW
jgi:hypothetical protein